MLEVTLDSVRVVREKYEVEEEGTDGLLLGKIIEHSWDGFIGRISFGNSTGWVLAGIDDGPSCCRGLL